MHRQKQHVLGIIVLVLSILSVIQIGCERKKAPVENKILVGVLQHGSSIPLIVAKQENMFEKRGLDVSFKTLTPAQHIPSLLRGDVQILSASSFPVIFSTDQQTQGEIISYMTGGEASDGDVLYGIVVPKNSTAMTLQDLVGKTIGSASKFTIVNLRNVLGAKFNDRTGTTTIREVKDKGTLLEALRKGTFDAVVLDQPALSSTEVISSFKIIEQNFRAKYLGSPYWSGSGVASRKWVASHKSEFELFLSAVDEALEFCKQNPDKAKQIFISYFNIKDLQPDRIGMYVYPNAKYAPNDTFVSNLANILESNGMLSPQYNHSGLFYQ